jgi:methylisocitrate lyase
MTNSKISLLQALENEKPLQLVGVINAYAALLAQRAGFKALYLSGAGVANASYGLPDIGITTLDNVLEDVRRILAVVDLPLLVDIDTGWGGAFMIAKSIKALERAGVAAVHMEDQVFFKRCGHRPGKALCTKEEMVDRVKAAIDAKESSDFVVMARTDALAGEGLEKAVERAVAYKDAGADMIFAEAVTDLEQYKVFKDAVGIPVLANITEFGQTPLFTVEELSSVGIDLVLYPLSANRAMNKAAENVFKEIRSTGTQKGAIDAMQTREELYDILDYHDYEKKLDALFNN